MKVGSVLKKKHEIDNAGRNKRKEDIKSLKDDAKYRRKLAAYIPKIDELLKDTRNDGVIIKVPDNLLNLFSNAIYSEEMAVYDVSQLDVNTFVVSAVEFIV